MTDPLTWPCPACTSIPCQCKPDGYGTAGTTADIPPRPVHPLTGQVAPIAPESSLLGAGKPMMPGRRGGWLMRGGKALDKAGPGVPTGNTKEWRWRYDEIAKRAATELLTRLDDKAKREAIPTDKLAAIPPLYDATLRTKQVTGDQSVTIRIVREE